jgi:uncharacterized membrane protein
MRSTLDRLRHTLLFELFALLSVTPIIVWITNKPVISIGTLALSLSLIAMILNYGFNQAFDILEIKIKGRRNRNFSTRILHTLLFELVMLVCTIPIIAWWLDMTVWQAFMMDIGFMLFFMVYALLFNTLYDNIFPVEEITTKISR